MALNMRKQWERVKTEPGLKRNVVALTALVLVAVLAGGWILGNQQFTPPWSSDQVVKAEFEAAPGIAPGNGQEVRVSGVIVGNITGADVNKAGRAEITMRVKKGVAIYDDATLVLRPKSPLNEMYVTIDPGSPPARRISSGKTFPVTSTRRPVQVDEVLGSLNDDARGALTALLSESDDALATAPAHLAAGLDGTGAVLDDLKPVVSQLDQRRTALKRLVAAVGDISSAVGDNDTRLISLASSLQSTLDAVGDQSGAFGQTLDRLPGVVSRLRSSTAAVSSLTQDLNPTLRDVQAASDVLPGALKRVTRTTQTLDKTLQIAKPVLSAAKPVAADLRPFVGELRNDLPVFERTTARLDPITGILLKYLPDLGAFMVNTRSLTSLRDGNGGILRGMLLVTPGSLPSALLNSLAPTKVAGPRG